MKRWLVRWGWALASLWMLSSCQRLPDEQRIVAAIESMEAAAEGGDRGAFLDHLSDDFSGLGGAYDRAGMGDLLRLQLLRHTRVAATVSQIEIHLFEGRATAAMNVLLVGGPKAWLPTSGRLYRVDTIWRRRDDRWWLASADWEVQL